MEPVSMTAACVALLTNIFKLSDSLTHVIQEWRAAPGDLEAISRELQSMQLILESLHEAEEDKIPHNFRSHVLNILENCEHAVSEIELSFTKHQRSRFGLRSYWTFGGGKENIAKHRFNLECHKSALQIVLVIVVISITKDVKQNTAQLPAMKSDIRRIRNEFQQLRRQLYQDAEQIGRPSSNRRLRKYVDDMSLYTESVYDPSNGSGDYAVNYDPSNDPFTGEVIYYNPGSYRSGPRTFSSWWNHPYLTPSWNPSTIHRSSIALFEIWPCHDLPSDYPRLTFHTPIHYFHRETTIVRIGRCTRDRAYQPNYIGFLSKVVSRNHCEIYTKKSMWYIRDLKSISGTFLNSFRLSAPGRISSSYPLKDNDVLQLGMDHQNGVGGFGRSMPQYQPVRMVVKLYNAGGMLR